MQELGADILHDASKMTHAQAIDTFSIEDRPTIS